MKSLGLLGLISILAGCSTIHKIGIRAGGGILSKAGSEFTREYDLKFFEESVPGNLKLIEGLWYNDQSNEVLLTNLIKGFGGYGFAVSETHYLADKLAEKEKGPHLDQALSFYSKAMDYGVLYLQEKGISWKDMTSTGAADRVIDLFEDKLGSGDFMAVFYIAQSWGSLINLQRDNVELVSHLGTVKSMMDWVCGKDPEFEHGSCHLFYAAYEAGRPAMLGGNPEKGKQLFLSFIKKYPANLLARVAYVQFYVIPMMDEDAWNEQKRVLTAELKEWEKQKNFGNDLSLANKYRKQSVFNLYNAIAKERFNHIKKFEKDIF